MKKIGSILLILLLTMPWASAEIPSPRPSGDFLDPAELTGVPGVLLYDDWSFTDPLFGDTDLYFAYRYDPPRDLDGFIAQYQRRMEAEYAYPTEMTSVEGNACLCFGRGNGRNFLFYDYQGFMLLLTPVRFGFAPWSPAPMSSPTPIATPLPTAEPAPTVSSGEWRWVTVEVDCPNCVNGVCPICRGMGYITLYGQRVDCDKACPSCKGKGTITQRQYQYFP